MKAFHIFILLLLMNFLGGCKKENELLPKKYPYFFTLDVTDISEEGATFHASVVDAGQEEIEDFGFIWKEDSSAYRVSIKDSKSLDDFQYRITNDLIKDLTYSCQAYIRTDKSLVLGNVVHFVSQGSESPIITDFNPKDGFDGTVIKLTGKNFSRVPENNIILVHGMTAHVLSSSQDSITFIIPEMTYSGDADIVLKIINALYTAPTPFHIHGPEIYSIAPLSGKAGTHVILHGQYLTQNGPGTGVLIGPANCEIVSVNDNYIEFIVPPLVEHLLSPYLCEIQILNGYKYVSYPEKFNLINSWKEKKGLQLTDYYILKTVTYQDKGLLFETGVNGLMQYDPVADAWSKMESSDFPGQGYVFSQLHLAGHTLYRFGGYDGMHEEGESAVWEYDLEAKTWTRKNDLPFRFVDAATFTLNDNLYVLTDDSQLWKCDLSNDSYTLLGATPFSFQYLATFAFTSNDKAYVTVKEKTYQYDPVNDSWTEKNGNPYPNQAYALNTRCFSYQNTACMLAGGTEMYMYDPAMDTWNWITNYPGPGGNTSLKTQFVIGDTLYVMAYQSSYYGEAPFMFSFGE